MRDPKRIDGLIDLVRRIWKANPDLRLGQLIGNCAPIQDAYYIEDDALWKRLHELYGEIVNENAKAPAQDTTR